ncbi:hypothetical protein EDD21DRAFT_349342 [Dissophora ornata]|nr:hypothetical protein BGZ58_008410 [Dissophora ornata]KAI8606181.1 hypothetical protein EDD21DRAFT_349342 [Dissophora ornata]
MPEVFSEHYFQQGLRLIPAYGSRVVYIPDIIDTWVQSNILPPYRSNYILQLLNSLLYLRFSSRTGRQKNMTDHEQGMVFERVAALDISSASTGATLLTPFQQEVLRQKRIQCLIHGDETNIDEDMWRLYELWKKLALNEKNLMEICGHPREAIRMPFPEDGPRLQLMLKNDERYLQAKKDIMVFDQWYEVPDGHTAPPSPILAATPVAQQASGGLSASSSSMTVEDACLRWTQEVLQEEQRKTGGQSELGQHKYGAVASGGAGEESGYSIIALPDIEGLKIQE